MSLHMATDHTNAVKWLSKLTFKDSRQFQVLHLIEMYKTEIEYNKPVYVGTSILDISKLCMMDFHYNIIEKNFKDKYNLIYSDTDSLVYNIQHDDIYRWITENNKHFDLSDSIRTDLKDNSNKKVLGKFKDELNTLIMTEFIALNPKVYSINHQTLDEFNNVDIKNKKTLKGISKTVVKNEINHEDYVKVLETDKPEIRKVMGFRSYNHEVFTYFTPKIALSSVMIK